MICNKCGQECADDVKFCTNCGMELSEEVKEEPATEEVTAATEDTAEAVQEEVVAVAEEKEAAAEETVAEVKEEKAAKKLLGDDAKKNTKFVAIGLAVVAILLLILIPAISMSSKDDSYMKISEKSVFQIDTREDELYAYCINGKEIALDDEEAYSETYSMDGSVVCYENEEDELVIIKDGKVIKTGIDDATNVMVSNAGDTLVYFSDCEMATYYDAKYEFNDTIRVGTLNLYDIKKKNNVEVAEEVVVGSAVLSPNGKTVAYVAEYDATDDFKGFYSVNGKEPVEVGKEKRVFAIADKAKYVYYTDVDRLYVMTKKGEEKLASEIRYAEVLLNADHSEMLFFNEDKTYITVKGGEKKKVAGSELNYIILGDDAAEYVNEVDKENGSVTVTYTGVDTFEEKLFYSEYEDEIYYMLKKLDTEKLASGAYQYAVADDGESLVYVDGVDIVKVTKFSKGGEKERIAEDVLPRYLFADGELKHIYFINWEAELCYVKKGEGKKIADDVTSAEISPDGSFCYYLVEDEDFCYSKNGGKEKELMSVEDGNIGCMRENGIVFVAVSEDDTNTLYRMDGKKMKTVYVEEEKAVEDYLEDALENFEDYEDYLDYLEDFE